MNPNPGSGMEKGKDGDAVFTDFKGVEKKQKAFDMLRRMGMKEQDITGIKMTEKGDRSGKFMIKGKEVSFDFRDQANPRFEIDHQKVTSNLDWFALYKVGAALLEIQGIITHSGAGNLIDSLKAKQQEGSSLENQNQDTELKMKDMFGNEYQEKVRKEKERGGEAGTFEKAAAA
jgi:hypothetical protein